MAQYHVTIDSELLHMPSNRCIFTHELGLDRYKVAILNVDQLLVWAYENSKEVWRDESNIDYILVKEKPESPWVILDAGR